MSSVPVVGTVFKLAAWVKSVFFWLRSFVPGVQLVLGIIALIVAAVFGYIWYTSQDTMVQTFLGALSYKAAPTSQEYKALEAVVLSALDDGAGSKDGDAISEELDEVFSQVRAMLEKKPLPSLSPPPPARRRAAPAAAQGYLSGVRITLNLAATDKRVWHQYLTLDEQQTTAASDRLGLSSPEELKNVFLYVPGITLGNDGLDAAIKREDLQAVLKKDVKLQKDIAGALELAKYLPKFEAVDSIFRNSPSTAVQSYFITRSGVALLRQAGVTNQRTHYDQVFRETGYTFLPGRPYFWPTVRNRYERQTRDRNLFENRGFNYQSAPYIDLGINGPIRTYCWGFVGGDTPNTTDAVLCLDVALADASERIERMLENNLTGNVTRPTCSPTRRCTDQLLTDFLQKNPENGTQELFGTIHVFSRKDVNEPLVFTVPLETKEEEEGRPKVTLIKATIDLRSMQQQRLLIGLISVGGIVFFLAIVITLFLVYLERKHESVKLLNNLDGVMAHISEPYVRVDPDDKIRKANASFKRLLEVEDVEGRDIRDYLEPGSRRRYEEEKEKREKGDYSIYELTFIKTQSKTAVVRIAHGVPLPVPKEFQKRVPDRFGIFTSPN